MLFRSAKVPFKRSVKNSDDFATTRDVLVEVVEEYRKFGVEFENICCVYPCVPFLNSEIVHVAYEKFLSSGVDMLMPIVKFSFPIQRAVKINSQGYLEYNMPQFASTRSQDLEPMYHDVGMFYFYKYSSFYDIKNIVPYEMDERFVQDIDNESDWEMAELKLRILRDIKL